MRCLFTLVLSILLLVACAHQPPPPDWLLTARSIDRNTQARQRAEKYGIKLIRPDELADLKTAILRWMTQ